MPQQKPTLPLSAQTTRSQNAQINTTWQQASHRIDWCRTIAQAWFPTAATPQEYTKATR